jgi:hypothetical protein
MCTSVCLDSSPIAISTTSFVSVGTVTMIGMEAPLLSGESLLEQ